MIFHDAVLAVLLVGAAGLLAGVAAVPHAVAVLRHWDTGSGSARQLVLERRTTLVSAVIAAMLVAQVVALLLFVVNADRMATRFVGAMCALGTLQVNRWGFPALFAQVALLFAAGMWLTLNAVDVRSPHYPLTRAKHGLLLGVVPLAGLSFALQLAYFAGLRADVITSCCGSLFSTAPGVAVGQGAGAFAAWPPSLAIPAFFTAIAAVAALAFLVGVRRRGGALLGVAGVAGLAVSLLAIVAFVAPYVYEDPRHHCPFCILKAEYGYAGYLLYLPLFGATAAALGALALQPFAGRTLVAEPAARATRALGMAAGTLFAVFALVVGSIIATSRLVLIGHGAG